MSAFAGAVLLSGHGDVARFHLASPPDEPGLDRARQLGGSNAAVIHRQRVVTPEDRHERQPHSAWGGKGWVAFAGRLDDRSTLAAALDFGLAETVTDGELARLAIERWGAEAPRRFLGDFTIAAWHADRRELILAADPTGMRTTYYWQQGPLVMFSTTLRGLIAMPRVPRALNDVFIADYLASNFDDEATVYRDILKVRAGATIVLSPDGARTANVHQFDFERRITLKDDQAYVQAAREILDRAVADRMRAAGPVPILASGGLDSACLAISALARDRPATLLTAVPDPRLPSSRDRKQYVDERPLVEALVAAFPRLNAEFLEPAANADWNPEGQALLIAAATPHRGPGQVAWFDALHRRAAALGAQSVLTGALGNATLTWEGLRRLPDLLHRGEWLTLCRELVLGSRGNPRELASLIRYDLVEPLRARDFHPRTLAAHSGLHPAAIRDLKVMDRMRSRGNDPKFVVETDGRRWRARMFKKSGSRRPEIANMIHALYGLDLMAPLADLRMIDFCLAIPDDQFLRNGTTRWLARRLLSAAGVPAVITENRLRGAQHPEWFAHLTQVRPSFPAQIERLRRSPTASRLIDVDRLERLVRDWPENAAAAHRRSVQFQALLPSALAVGAFIAWAEGTN